MFKSKTVRDLNRGNCYLGSMGNTRCFYPELVHVVDTTNKIIEVCGASPQQAVGKIGNAIFAIDMNDSSTHLLGLNEVISIPNLGFILCSIAQL